MNHYDPLDWLHQWDSYEMMMYALHEETPGIFMQVSRKQMQSGAEEWEILYDRKIADVCDDATAPPGSDDWQEHVLRHYLNDHPELVADEKGYLQMWLNNEANA
jgi:hypothetical protein